MKQIPKRALLLCGLSILLCIAMLAGTSFAWFWVAIENTGNTITAGNITLDVLGYDAQGNALGSLNRKNCPPLIDETEWLAGSEGTVYLEVINNGSLDMKYTISFSVQDGGLENVLEYKLGTVTAIAAPFADDNMPQAKSVTDLPQEDCSGTIAAGDSSAYWRLDYWLPADTGNIDYEGKSISVTIRVTATQATTADEGDGDGEGESHPSELVPPVQSRDSLEISEPSESEIDNHFQSEAEPEGEVSTESAGSSPESVNSESVENVSVSNFESEQGQLSE